MAVQKYNAPRDAGVRRRNPVRLCDGNLDHRVSLGVRGPLQLGKLGKQLLSARTQFDCLRDAHHSVADRTTDEVGRSVTNKLKSAFSASVGQTALSCSGSAAQKGADSLVGNATGVNRRHAAMGQHRVAATFQVVSPEPLSSPDFRSCYPAGSETRLQIASREMLRVGCQHQQMPAGAVLGSGRAAAGPSVVCCRFAARNDHPQTQRRFLKSPLASRPAVARGGENFLRVRFKPNLIAERVEVGAPRQFGSVTQRIP